MRNRCSNKNNDAYKHYGGRGIKVCPEWNTYLAFKEWAVSHGYADNLTIDRKDNDKGYSPDNCRWATMKEQALNRRSTHLITYKDETHSISEWSEILNFPVWTILNRIRYGWAIEKILTTPIKKTKPYKKRAATA
jgi:hypothetical protein